MASTMASILTTARSSATAMGTLGAASAGAPRPMSANKNDEQTAGPTARLARHGGWTGRDFAEPSVALQPTSTNGRAIDKPLGRWPVPAGTEDFYQVPLIRTCAPIRAIRWT